MTHFPDHLGKIESRIINRLISAILDAGYSIRVGEGEEGERLTRPTRHRPTIQSETAATCITLFDIMQGDAERLATIVLIHGNGEDVISDVSYPASRGDVIAEEIEAFLGHANQGA